MGKWAFLFVIVFWGLNTHAQGLQVGQQVDNINLLSTTGERFDLSSNKALKGLIVVFTSPNCDYCLMYTQRLIALHTKYAKKGYPVVAISSYSNDPLNYPLDAPKAVNKWIADNKVNFPFLIDESFKYTNLFDIKNTPEVVLLKRKGKVFDIKYMGKIDEDPAERTNAPSKLIEQALKKM